MTFTKRVYSKTKKVFIYGSGSLALFFALLISLSYLGIDVQTSGDQICSDICISYFNISLKDYSLCFGSTFKGVTTEPNVIIEIYKADMRYRLNNPLRWKPYNLSANKCLDKNKTHEFKIIGYKQPEQTIKWGLDLQGKNLDPFWYGINTTANISTTELLMELGSQVNITANISGATSVCVDIDHPAYNVSYVCGTPSATFLFNITYFRNNQFNDSQTIKNISFRDNQANQTIYIKQHQYDEIINASINITGFINNGTYPTNVKLYINNSLSNNLGLVYSGNIILNELNDSSTIKNITFSSSPQTKTDYFKIPKNANVVSAYLNLTGYEGECDQETANITSFCGGLSTGNYKTDGNWVYLSRIYDETWDTYGYCTPTEDCNLTINYTKPALAVNATWKIKREGPITNLPIPSDCFNYPNISLRLNSRTGLSPITLNVQCFNGTWKNLVTYTTYSFYIYEEQVIWNMTYNIWNASMESGINDGLQEWNYTGLLNSTNKTSNFNTSIMTYLSSCSQDNNGYCSVPIYITSATKGKIQISDIQINFSSNPNPVYLNITLIENFLNYSSNFANIPLKFESSQNGTLQIDDIRLDYAGGNKTSNILVYTQIAKKYTNITSIGNYTFDGTNVGEDTAGGIGNFTPTSIAQETTGCIRNNCINLSIDSN
mgnify:CR=1 FL=1